MVRAQAFVFDASENPWDARGAGSPPLPDPLQRDATHAPSGCRVEWPGGTIHAPVECGL